MKTEPAGQTKTKTNVCEACGKEFGCGVETGSCWCFTVDLAEETLSEIGEKFQNCLCEDCLKAAARKV